MGRPRPAAVTDRDEAGKEALYSTSPQAQPSSPILVTCERCDVERGVGLREGVKLLTPPMFWRPFSCKFWAKCPTCDQRSWLRVRQGQAIKAFLSRPGS